MPLHLQFIEQTQFFHSEHFTNIHTNTHTHAQDNVIHIPHVPVHTHPIACGLSLDLNLQNSDDISRFSKERGNRDLGNKIID